MKLEVQTNELKKYAIAQEMLAHHLRMEQQRLSWLGKKLGSNISGAEYDISKLEENVYRQAVFAMQLSCELEQIRKIYARTEERLF